MADGMVVAELALKPSGVGRNPNRRFGCGDHSHCLVDNLLRFTLVVLQALGINVIVVFVDHKVKRTMATIFPKLID